MREHKIGIGIRGYRTVCHNNVRLRFRYSEILDIVIYVADIRITAVEARDYLLRSPVIRLLHGRRGYVLLQ